MIVKPAHLRPIPSFLLPFAQSSSAGGTQSRCLHHGVKAARVPRPTPFVPNSETFLTLIGRGLSQHASKIASWKALFQLTSDQLKDLGVEPPRNRRYLLRWREKFRKGQFGIGGDLVHVENGTSELRVVELPPVLDQENASSTLYPRTRRIVVNVAAGDEATNSDISQLVPVKGLHVKGAHTIVGPHVQPMKGGSAAKLVVTEGMWEDRRGHKIDGGERRQGEVRAKQRGEEKRAR